MLYTNYSILYLLKFYYFVFMVTNYTPYARKVDKEKYFLLMEQFYGRRLDMHLCWPYGVLYILYVYMVFTERCFLPKITCCILQFRQYYSLYPFYTANYTVDKFHFLFMWVSLVQQILMRRCAYSLDIYTRDLSVFAKIRSDRGIISNACNYFIYMTTVSKLRIIYHKETIFILKDLPLRKIIILQVFFICGQGQIIDRTKGQRLFCGSTV